MYITCIIKVSKVFSLVDLLGTAVGNTVGMTIGLNSGGGLLAGEGRSNDKDHDEDLGNAEEAPDGGLLAQVGGDEGGQVGAEQEQEGTLQHHLPTHDKEGTEPEHKWVSQRVSLVLCVVCYIIKAWMDEETVR